VIHDKIAKQFHNLPGQVKGKENRAIIQTIIDKLGNMPRVLNLDASSFDSGQRGLLR